MSDSGDVSQSEPEQEVVKSAKKNNKRKRKQNKKKQGNANADASPQKQGKPNAGASPLKKAKTDSPKTPAIAPKDSSDESSSEDVSAGVTASSKVPEGTILDLGRDYHVKINVFKGKTYLDFRGYYRTKDSPELKPGRKGVSLQPDQWAILTKNISIIDKAIAAAK